MNPRPWSAAWRPLVAAAAEALRHAKGRPRWAATVEDKAGGRYAGASISIRDVPAASLCAEQIAVAQSRLSGDHSIRRVVVIAPGPQGASPPCGRCLQVLREFGPDIEVRWGTVREERGRGRLSRLLPRAFVDYRTSP
jgi:cytidine deaminase